MTSKDHLARHHYKTKLGSDVEVYYEDVDRLYGRYWTGSEWIPCKWFKDGKYVEDRECSLDLLIPLECKHLNLNK